MQRLDGHLVLSPTDLTGHQECTHLTWLDLGVASGSDTAPFQEVGAATQLIFDRGTAHEKKYLESLKAAGKQVAEIPTAFDAAGRRDAEQRTVEAMRKGFDVIYQATFYDGAWGGQADFLLRVEEPSKHWPWSYEIADTKLARHMKVGALLQMATYAERLAVLQGKVPQHIYVVTGDDEKHPWRLVDVAAYARRARNRLETFVDSPPPTSPAPVGHCRQCRWAAECEKSLRKDDDLSLVAFMRGNQREALRAVGIMTLEDLVKAEPEQLRRSALGEAARIRLQQQAAEQLRGRDAQEPTRTLLSPEPNMGLLRLPEPSPGDLYLDFEGDPYFDDGKGLEYLAGIGDRDGNFRALWAHDRDAEKQMVIDLVDTFTEAVRRNPRMHVYHYAPYEVTALKKLTGKYGVRGLDQLLRDRRFVDLYPVVRQSMRISKESYSIKKVEAFYGRSHDGDVASAIDSVVMYEQWMTSKDPDMLQKVHDYNKDDVDSTRELHDWLEEQRAELEAATGFLDRPVPAADDLTRTGATSDAEESELGRSVRGAGHELLADLLDWHRREALPAWWEVYRLQDLDAEGLVEDPVALGGLGAPRKVGAEKRSKLYAYEVPTQETKLQVGDDALDVDTARKVGTVFALDAVEGRLVLKTTGEDPAPRGVGPGGPLNTDSLRKAIEATAEDVQHGRSCLGQALIERRVPAGTPLREGETTTEAVVRLGLALDGEVLAIQGPPGSGKTTTAAELIRALLDAGKTVGVTATSHAVIGNVLKKVGRPALQKCPPHQHCGAAHVRSSNDSAVVARELLDGSATLVGGTAWLWARTDLVEAVDVLIVDEAGQFSLANAVAVARGAKSLVLLGDPQQLAQPTQGVHPGDSGASALEHLLDGQTTIPVDRGVFLDRSFRMHPDLTAFVSDLAYEGRLDAAAGRERIALLGDGPLAGSGLRLHTVKHDRIAAAESEEEADAVARLWKAVQGTTWRYLKTFETADGPVEREVEGGIRPEDVLVVAPYNAQVRLIKEQLPDGARVGTVDKFQGQEAAVVIYSMTSTSADEAPRGVEFLYDLNRLNVAISRAQALAVVVMSPLLLDAPVRTTEQLRRVNALCRLAETATALDLNQAPPSPDIT